MRLTNPKVNVSRTGAPLVVGMHFTCQKRGIKQGMHVLDWLQSQSGYCLDAPDEMPAGGCFSRVWEPAPPKFLGSEQIFQMTVKREGDEQDES